MCACNSSNRYDVTTCGLAPSVALARESCGRRGLLRVRDEAAGDGRVPVGAGGEDGMELTQQIAGPRAPCWGCGGLVVAPPSKVRVSSGVHGVVLQQGGDRPPCRQAELGAAPAADAVLPW